MSKPARGAMKIVLVTPEIPGNTGTIGRTCVALDIELILIRPYGFEITDKSVRRAGLDYWQHLDWETVADIASLQSQLPTNTRCWYYSALHRPGVWFKIKTAR